MNRAITCLTALMCAAVSGFAFGQTYPTKAIRIIAPFAPGGGTDLIARVAAQKMTESLGQTILVDNRARAGVTTSCSKGINGSNEE